MNKSSMFYRIADEMWKKGLIEVGDEIMEADAKYHGPHMHNGFGTREDWKHAVGMYGSAFPDSFVKYEDLIETDNIVIGRWSATATNTGKLAGMPPTEKSVTIQNLTVHRIDKNNHIAET